MLLTSPGLPFCIQEKSVSRIQPVILPITTTIQHNNDVYTNLPLGKTQFRLSTALGSETRTLLERSADGAGSDGQVAVVAIKSQYRIGRALLSGIIGRMGYAYVKPAAFHAAAILKTDEVGGIVFRMGN
jgi:hypothetical protein